MACFFMALTMNNRHLVTKSNDLIEARYKLSMNEQRLIILLISIIQPDDDDFYDYEVLAVDFAAMFGLDLDGDVYATVEKTAGSLVGKRLHLLNGDESNHVAWLANARYIRGKGVVTVSFHKSLKPYLLHLKSRFTQYNIKCVVKFKNSYSIRFYELFKSYEYLGEGGKFYRDFQIDELKSFLGIENGLYKLFGHFKNKVIEPSINEINLHSDLSVSSVEYIKKGRAINNIRFTVEPKSIVSGNELVAFNGSSSVDMSSDGLIALMDFDIARPTAQKWLKEFGNENILNACKYVRAKQADGKVKDVPAYLAKTLKEEYYVAWMEEDRKKEEKLAIALAQKAEKEEKEKREREEALRRVDAILEAFHALPSIEQVGYRTIFSTSTNPAMARMWKKCAAVDPTPESDSKFRFAFAEFLQNYQPPS